jgi:hypothetical protein
MLIMVLFGFSSHFTWFQGLKVIKLLYKKLDTSNRCEMIKHLFRT